MKYVPDVEHPTRFVIFLTLLLLFAATIAARIV